MPPSRGIGLASDDRMSAFTCGRGFPGTNALGHSQSSLRDWFRWECTPRTDVLGYLSRPSGLIAKDLIADLFSGSALKIGLAGGKLLRAWIASDFPGLEASEKLRFCEGSGSLSPEVLLSCSVQTFSATR